MAVELLPVVRRERPDAVVIIGFETEEGQAEPASSAMRDAIESAGIRVLDRLLVRDGRWWSLDCDGGCCPADGEPLQTDDEVPAVADYVLRGRRPAGSRADLADAAAPRPEPGAGHPLRGLHPRPARPPSARGRRWPGDGG